MSLIPDLKTTQLVPEAEIGAGGEEERTREVRRRERRNYLLLK